MSDNEKTYQAAAAVNVVVTAKPAVLERVIIGADVASAVVEISDHASDGNGNVKVYLAGSTLLGVYEVGAVFQTGITMDLTNQTHISVIWRNVGSN